MFAPLVILNSFSKSWMRTSASPLINNSFIGCEEATSRTNFNPFPRFSGARPEINSVKAISTAEIWLLSAGRTRRSVFKIPNPRSARTMMRFWRSYPKNIPGISGHFPKLWENESMQYITKSM